MNEVMVLNLPYRVTLSAIHVDQTKIRPSQRTPFI